MTPEQRDRLYTAARAFVDALVEAVEAEAPAAPERLLTVEETRAVVRVSRSTLYGLFDAGKIGTLYVGRRRFVPWSQVEAFMDLRSGLEQARTGQTRPWSEVRR